MISLRQVLSSNDGFVVDTDTCLKIYKAIQEFHGKIKHDTAEKMRIGVSEDEQELTLLMKFGEYCKAAAGEKRGGFVVN